ncbi:MAG: TauD/TfdA dioxygenase family protein [Minwuia sp.]|uniref:TauD/TfdA dioxygenase family protein n=1 Tax=Minwuia sp. TaxID=2493630 RepID=UPI003A8ABB22
MELKLWPVTGQFAAEVDGIDLSRPLDPETVDAIKAAFWAYAVLIFPDQHLTQQQHVDFAAHFGPLETSIGKYRKDQKKRIRLDLADVSNLGHGDEILSEDNRLRQFQLGNRLWHTDSSFKYVPGRASLLYARSIPPTGGLTEFADERAAWDALPTERQAALDGLIAEHCIRYSRMRMGYRRFTQEEIDAMPPVPQVLVRTIPETGRRNLYLASHALKIHGMDDDAARALIDELIAHATQRQFVYSHRWRVNDLVMWDNRCTMHRGTPFDDLTYKRDVQRATVGEPANSVEMAGLPLPEIAA